MIIGELARRTGLTNSRIRFYASAGVLKIVERRPNGYRTYPSETVLVLELITTAQKAGFSLDEIRSLLPLDLGQWNNDALIAALRRKVQDIEALQVRLKQSKAQLVALIRDIEAKPNNIDGATNAHRVLSRMLGNEIEKPTMAAGDVKLPGRASRAALPDAASRGTPNRTSSARRVITPALRHGPTQAATRTF